MAVTLDEHERVSTTQVLALLAEGRDVMCDGDRIVKTRVLFYDFTFNYIQVSQVPSLLRSLNGL